MLVGAKIELLEELSRSVSIRGGKWTVNISLEALHLESETRYKMPTVLFHSQMLIHWDLPAVWCLLQMPASAVLCVNVNQTLHRLCFNCYFTEWILWCWSPHADLLLILPILHWKLQHDLRNYYSEHCHYPEEKQPTDGRTCRLPGSGQSGWKQNRNRWGLVSQCV